MDFRRISLVIAESVDAWRIIPRVILILYATLVFNLYLWYKSIPTYINEQCDAGVLGVLMERGLSLEEAKVMACSVIDIVGGPTAAQSTFVTTIIGLSTGIFGLYVATGRKWERGLPYDVTHPDKPFPTPGIQPNTPHNPYNPHKPHNPYTPHKPYAPPTPHRPYGPYQTEDDAPYGPQPAQNQSEGFWGDAAPDNDPDDDNR
jgi:hypothetical protein